MDKFNRLLSIACTALTAALMAGCAAFLAVRAPGFEISWLPVYLSALMAAAAPDAPQPIMSTSIRISSFRP